MAITVIDVGKQKNKDIKKLKKGKGPLIAEAVDQAQTAKGVEGATDGGGTMIIVVKKRDAKSLRRAKKARRRMNKGIKQGTKALSAFGYPFRAPKF